MHSLIFLFAATTVPETAYRTSSGEIEQIASAVEQSGVARERPDTALAADNGYRGGLRGRAGDAQIEGVRGGAIVGFDGAFSWVR